MKKEEEGAHTYTASSLLNTKKIQECVFYIMEKEDNGKAYEKLFFPFYVLNLKLDNILYLSQSKDL